MVWKVSEHVKGLLLWFNHSSVLSLLQGWAYVFSCLLICWSDLKLYYLVTLQFVSGLIQIVSMDKFCIIRKKIQVRFKTKAFNNFLWKIHSMLLLQYFKTQTSKFDALFLRSARIWPISNNLGGNSRCYFGDFCKQNSLRSWGGTTEVLVMR